jgi:hypothetical protein
MTRIVGPQDDAALNGSPHEVTKPQRVKNLAARTSPSQQVDDGRLWGKAAPRALRQGGLNAGAAWNRLWHKRRSRSSVARLVHAIGSPLAWGVNRAAMREESGVLVDIVDELDRGGDARRYTKGKRQERLQEAVQRWLESARDGDTNVSFALGCLALAHLLDRLGGALEADDGWAVIDFLVAAAADAQGWDAKSTATADAMLAQQLLACELPLTLAYLFPEIRPLAKLARPASPRLAESLAILLGDKGVPHANQIAALRGLLACWTRCRAIGSQYAKDVWAHDAQRRLELAFRQALRWTDGQGLPLLATAHAKPWTPDFLAAAHRIAGGKREASAAHALLGKSGLAQEVPSDSAEPIRPSMYSEQSQLALLRASWKPRAAAIAIDYSGHGMRVEASASGQALFHGMWTATSRCDGKLLKPVSGWDVVCWFADKDVDYIEFRMDLDEGARVERQVLLARKDQFVFLADHLQCAAGGALEHAWQLPVDSSLTWNAADETREAVLTSERLSVRVLPLALPEWRIDPRMGELTCADGAMRLAQHATARAVACPTFIDLKPGRADKPCTWRQLTVAESLQIQPSDVAVGYRVQCGRKQWLLYRSQAARGNRTVLGQNTSAEFVAARFLAPSGEIEELILVDA